MDYKNKTLAFDEARQKSERPRFAFLATVDCINTLIIRLCGVAMLVMVLCVVAGILTRFVFSHLQYDLALPWTEEVSRYLMIWVVFLGAAVAARKGKLIGVQVLIYALPRNLGAGLKYLSILISLGFYLILIWVGLEWTEFGRTQGSPVMEMPMAVAYSAMSVGFSLSVLNTLALVYEAWHSTGILDAEEDDEIASALAEDKA
jgi:TRAP-type C4-dicarboxylate transport system permease small subunit